MLRAYRLLYPDSPHAPPQLWEYEQPYIHYLLVNARTFRRSVEQRYFQSWDVLARENAHIWNTDYRPCLLYEPFATWEVWLPEYRELVIEVQAIADAHGWRGPPVHA